MDPEVWKYLPDHEEILRLILCRVSWDTNLRLRSVSKGFYATLSEPSVFTWSSMLTDTSFYTDHSSLKWVDGDIDAEHLEQSHADAVCFFSPLSSAEREPADFVLSSSKSLTFAVVNFELRRWCTLPPLGDLPFGNLNDFTVSGVAKGLLLLERTMSEGRHSDDSLLDTYELDRFLFNPVTKGFIKLPVVPNIKGLVGNQFRMIMAVEKEHVTVVAVEFAFYLQPGLPRILVWHQGSQDWVLLPTTILPVHNTMFLWFGTNTVFVGGELFLHVETQEIVSPGERSMGERVFSFGSRACAINPELIWNCNNIVDAKTHLFHHSGALKRLELEVVTGGRRRFHQGTLGCSIDLYTFNCSSRTWQEKESIGMPRHLLESVFKSSEVAGVFGDVLCIRNLDEPAVFILYNFLTKQWCRCYAKGLVEDAEIDHGIFFLWSPKRYDSWQIAPRFDAFWEMFFLVSKKLKQDEEGRHREK
ncbi:hypothetical protein R1sor_003225 [Riccia sorocarpa]|uniref:F-box domain-containing protein n=1 Tax=Riccia sorocarpa TaxID=122646 RepID=A0ABD3H0Z0_9MARC